MARSLGNHAIKGGGVVADPMVRTHALGKEDKVLIVATDGVWEFLLSAEAVAIMGQALARAGDQGEVSAACMALIAAATAKWYKRKGDYCNNITAIVVRLKELWRELPP